MSGDAVQRAVAAVAGLLPIPGGHPIASHVRRMDAAMAAKYDDVDICLLHPPVEYKPTELGVAKAKRSIKVAVGTDPYNGEPERVITIPKGTKFLSTEPIVNDRPEWFEIEAA